MANAILPRDIPIRAIPRRDFLRHTLAGLAWLGCGPGLASAVTNDEVIITILHTNDVHSRIDPFPPGPGRLAGLGGAARRGTVINAIRAANPNTLLVDAGDAFQGTPYFNLFHGEVDFRVMSALGYDAMTIGNHEFDAGMDGLRAACAYATFPLLSANYDVTGTVLSEVVRPYTVRQTGTVRVGLFGLGIMLEGLVAPQLCAGVKYSDPIQAARLAVEHLRSAEKCDLVVCLSHLGDEGWRGQPGDEQLAREVAGIDLVVGGHGHTFMDEPSRIRHGDRETLVFQVGWAGVNLGRVDFHMSAGEPVRSDAWAIPIDGSLAACENHAPLTTI